MSSETEVPVFDIDQLRNICMEDTELMRELVLSLIDDAGAQIPALQEAIEQADAARCARVAHYVKGACANVGAVSMAALLKTIERNATAGDFDACRNSLLDLNRELEKFSSQAVVL
jgi:HPt (histidine-containing phosphotransfer) domain-containing protein